MKIVLAVLCVVSYVLATEVRQCPNLGRTIDDLSNRVQIGNCKKPPCRLRKDTNVAVQIKFKPDRDIKSLKTTVNANILGIEFPFVGVDGTSACKDIYKEDGKTKVNCDLKAGEEYYFKSKIEVLKVYPRLKTVVHWALTDDEGKDVTCFEVPARITN
ncbi:NPC intracellular cholesterol transporter 2 homolog a [Leptinotarsa decemlineata]|uniref:NPC intracellular cholesterol transporter 2 homolog a n=1 Tax=Leptinotarsa decemlineata TaxID=7539 RepID=UPI000C254007|nr:protein NPC2 homolog [Leptinotarsa decemlineata]